MGTILVDEGLLIGLTNKMGKPHSVSHNNEMINICFAITHSRTVSF